MLSRYGTTPWSRDGDSDTQRESYHYHMGHYPLRHVASPCAQHFSHSSILGYELRKLVSRFGRLQQTQAWLSILRPIIVRVSVNDLTCFLPTVATKFLVNFVTFVKRYPLVIGTLEQVFICIRKASFIRLDFNSIPSIQIGRQMERIVVKRSISYWVVVASAIPRQHPSMIHAGRD